jgi:glycosyltransferase involved in cell wall biosynthesis
MQSAQPTVTVVMATYNGARFLREQIESILAQTYPVEALVIQDDGSDDDTIDIAREYAERHPQVRIYYNDTNLGFNRNFISVLKRSRSTFTAIADQDDVWFPDKLEKQVQAIGEADICHSYLYIGPTPHDRQSRWQSRPQNDFDCLLFTPTIYGHTMLVRTSLIERISDWGAAHITYDWRLSLEACLGAGIVCVPEYLNWHRPHAGSVVTMHRKRHMHHSEKATWQPYVLGFFDYYRVKRKPGWHWLYTHLLHRTARQHPLEHRLCALLLANDVWSLFRLCLLCSRHRATIHRRFAAPGVKNRIRGFFFPFIRSYTNTSFDF